ncbi:MAG: Inositol-phosphate phosphatase [Frankiales bacterium]|jgi:myo-inositol-1(or 4)-monophosphatase|nr:Inositol-phosphate phosphatase [Frankiales bacterium]
MTASGTSSSGTSSSGTSSSAAPAALLVLATDLARQAGALALSMREGIEQESTKSSPTDVVTAADRAAERVIVDGIRAARPGDGVLGEEGASDEGTTGVRWVIDPIDGTVNYLYGLPQWAVSIGVEVRGVTVAGVVFDPAKDELWQAVRGSGATCNGRPVRCSSTTELGQALVGTGFGYDARRRAAQARVLPELLPACRDLRRMGAGALDLCAVAAGRLDAYYEQGLSPWDLSAGGLIATEAGARLEGLGGAPAGPGMVLAAAPGVFEALHDLLARYGMDADPLES